MDCPNGIKEESAFVLLLCICIIAFICNLCPYSDASRCRRLVSDLRLCFFSGNVHFSYFYIKDAYTH